MVLYQEALASFRESTIVSNVMQKLQFRQEIPHACLV